MFWDMTGVSTASPVEAILDKDNFTLDELLDEDEIIQECKALNGRLINFLREKPQVEQLIRYIVEEAPEDAEKRRTFKFPFIACEIFTCEVDFILKALVEDEELMDMLFSFLRPTNSHSTLLAGCFSKVAICLLLRKTVLFMNYIKAHQEILSQLVDLIGITSIMELLIRLIGDEERIYTNYMEIIQWIEDTDLLDMIMDKFSSSDCPEVHSNAAETLYAIRRFAPPGLAAKISSPNFIERLFLHALEDSRPKSVLVNTLSICISLLDPKRYPLGAFRAPNNQFTHGSTITASPETVEGMLGNLDGLLKLFDVSSANDVLLTTFGKLQPPLGKHRLKIVEFISVLLTVGGEAAENALIHLGAVRRILDLFFEYPYNNFMHHHVENIISTSLESKNALLIKHLLQECNLIGKILEAEKNFTLAAHPSKATVPAERRSSPRIGNIGHLTRISNKLAQVGNNNSEIQAYLQESSEWNDWHVNVLSKRNAVENVYQWACGRPTGLQDRTRDSSDDDYQDRDYDVAALANNLSQAFRYGIYSNDDIYEAHGSLERDDEDVYIDDESAEVVISSLRLGDDQESGSLFTNSNWFAFEDDRIANERSSGAVVSSSPINEAAGIINGAGYEEVAVGEDEELDDTATSSLVNEAKVEDLKEAGPSGADKPSVWVEWRETPDSSGAVDLDKNHPSQNGELPVESKDQLIDQHQDATESCPSSSDALVNEDIAGNGVVSQLVDDSPPPISSKPPETSDGNINDSNSIPSADVKRTGGSNNAPEPDDQKDATKEAEK